MSVPDLLQTQTGKESSWGTGVTPTARFMGLESFTINPGVESKGLPDQRGSLQPQHHSEVARIAPGFSFESQLNYEDVNYWLEGMVGEITPTGSDPYTRTGAAPAGTQVTPRSQTIVHGGPNGAYGLVGAIPTELAISLATAMEGRISGSGIAKNRQDDALESLSDRTVTPVMGDHVTIYMDAWGGTIGSTELAALVFAAELSLSANRELSHRLSALTAGSWAGPKWSGSMKLTCEFDATTVNTLMDEFMAASPTAPFQKQVRLECVLDANHQLTLDFAGFSEGSPEAFGETDGIVSVEFNLVGEYNAALGNFFEYENINQVSALP